MQYQFTVFKLDKLDNGPFGSPDERFYCAVDFSARVISDILFDFDVTVYCNRDKITVASKSTMPFTLNECKELVKSAFLDDNSTLYPEFKVVKTEKI